MKFRELGDPEKDFTRLGIFVQEGNYYRIRRLITKYGRGLSELAAPDYFALLCVELLVGGSSEANGLVHRIVKYTKMPDELYKEVEEEFEKRLKNSDERNFNVETADWLELMQDSEEYREWMKAIKLK